MTTPLRVGILGLGPLWRTHYRPALRTLHDRFAISAGCDPISERARRTARRLDCAAAAGPTDLCGRANVDALLILDAPWYGLWPVGVACRLGKPVFCCLPATAEPDAARLRELIEASGVPVLAALPLRVAPATCQLLKLFETTLGKPRRVVCAGVGGQAPSALVLADWCGHLFGGQPLGIHRVAGQAVTCLELDYGEGRSAQLIACPGLSPRLDVIAERGTASLELPRRLRWVDETGRHAQLLPRRSTAAILLEEFAGALAGERVGARLADLLRLQERLCP
jgi:hypothetical protein